jgi:F0F1-type ATP synthase membrane subunit b/b'
MIRVVFAAAVMLSSSVALAAGGGDEAPIRFLPTGIMDPALLFALVNFGLLLALLGWKARPPINAFVLKKHKEIKDGLEEGTRLRKQAEDKFAEYAEKTKAVEADVDALIADIRAEAAAEKARLLKDAAAQAEATKKAAESRIAAEIQRARIEIEREVAAAAVAAAEKTIREKVKASDHQALFDNFIAELGSAKPAERRPS